MTGPRSTDELQDLLQRILTSLVVLRPILHEAVDGGIEAEAELEQQASWRPLTMSLTHLVDTGTSTVRLLRELEREAVMNAPADRARDALDMTVDAAAQQGAVPVVEIMAEGLRMPGMAFIGRSEHLLSVRAYRLNFLVAVRHSNGEVVKSIEPLRRSCDHVQVYWMSPESEHGLPYKGALAYDVDVVTLTFGERCFAFRVDDFRDGLDRVLDIESGEGDDAPAS